MSTPSHSAEAKILCESSTASTVISSAPQSSRSALFADPILLDLKVGDEIARFSEVGIVLKYVETMANEDPNGEGELGRQPLVDESAAVVSAGSLSQGDRDAIARSGVRRLTYIKSIEESGHFLTVCPISGRPVKSNSSFAIDGHHIAYRFSGEAEFYLIVGRFHGRRSALCVPSLNVLVTLDVPERGLSISRWVASSMRRLINYSVAEPTKFAENINSRTIDLTLVIGGMPNFGHHIWQELSGIAELIEGGYLHRVRSLLVGPHTWFCLEAVFPELAKLPVVRCATADEFLFGGLLCSGTLIRPVGIQITGSLRRRIRTAAAAALDTDLVQQIAVAGRRSRLVWINLRAHNKKWQNQVEGYAALLNALQEEFGEIGVVYDGWADTAGIRDDIDRRLRSDIIRHDTLGVSIETSLLWAEAVFTFVSVVGSGLVLNSWLVQKPGIAHGNRAHLNQRSFWNHVSVGAIPTIFIPANDVVDDGTLYGNYEFDWHTVFMEARKILQPVEHQPVADVAIVQ